MEENVEDQKMELKEKKKSHSAKSEEGEHQEFMLDYQREHSVAYLYKKMPYTYTVHKRILSEI